MNKSKVLAAMVLAIFVSAGLVFGQQQWDGAQDFTNSIFRTGNVGIGTPNPTALLHLKNPGGLPSLFFEGGVANLAVPKNQPMLFGHWDGTEFIERLRINPGGRLGIGTKEEPDAKLEVRSEGGDKSTLRVQARPYPGDPDTDLTDAAMNEAAITLRKVPVDKAPTPVSIEVDVAGTEAMIPVEPVKPPAFEATSFRKDGGAGHFSVINSRNSSSALFAHTSGTGRAGSFLINNTGSSTSALYVRTYGTGHALEMNGPENTGATAALKISSPGQNMLLDGNEIDAVEGGLFLNKNSRGNVVVPVLEITGGSDLAEPFTIEEEAEVQPGMVVAIDPTQPGQLRLARRAYDRTVAGIVSGANGIKPGLTMKQEDSMSNGTLPVALSGRVYCWVDAANGAIEPGDLLTTSDLPGYAMKVTDHAKAQGAIIGKAMMALEKGKGLVLVLVSLQ
jgi:hypothetical protein